MSSVTGRRTFARPVSLTNNQVFLQYYNENDAFLSPEGILKLISIVCCVALSVVSLTGAGGGGGATAAACTCASAGVALGVAAALALLVGARALHLPRGAPYACLLAEIIVLCVCGVAAALAGALQLALCRPAARLHYLRGPLALVIAALVIASASLTYFVAMRLWDAVTRGPAPAPEPRAPPAPEHDV